jgi:hypothetical protein
VITIYVDKYNSGKYVRYFLRDSYRQDGKVKHRTLTNLSNNSAEIQIIQIVQKLSRRWQDMDATVQGGFDELKTLCATELRIQGQPLCNFILHGRGHRYKGL